MSDFVRHICAEQIKGARGMLGWTQEALASASGLALNTIRRIENGKISPRDQTFDLIRQAIEKNGLEFIPDGIKRHKSETWTLTGQEGSQALYNDIMQSAVVGDCFDVVAIADSCDMLSNVFCDRDDWLNRLNEFANIKCLLLKDGGEWPDLENIRFLSVVSDQDLLHHCFIYGNKYVIVNQRTGDNGFRFTFCADAGLASCRHIQFDMIWEKYKAINEPIKPAKASRVSV